jgi:hypothetical protein
VESGSGCPQRQLSAPEFRPYGNPISFIAGGSAISARRPAIRYDMTLNDAELLAYSMERIAG